MSRFYRPTGGFLSMAVFAVLGAAPAGLSAQDVRVTTGTIEDRRTTGRFFGGLEIELKLTGDDVSDAKATRVLLRKALDESGRNLLLEGKADPDFSDGTSNLRVSLGTPARSAGALKELSGEVELFVPSRDKGATVVIDRFLSRMDKPVAAPALKSQGITVKLVSPKAYRATAKKREADLDREMEKNKAEMEKAAAAEGADPKEVEALMALVKGFAGMMDEVGDHDVVLEIGDEGKKLLDVEVVGSGGDAISSQGSITSGGVKILKFSEKLPADAKLRLLLKTKGSVVRAPFTLANVPLP
jgi:hypothetical protein